MTQPFYTHVYAENDALYVRKSDHSITKINDFPFKYYRRGQIGQHRAMTGESLIEATTTSPSQLRKLFRENPDYFGQENAEWQVIQHLHPETDIDYDYSQIKIWFIDIETNIDNEFPRPDQVKQPVNTITVVSRHYPISYTWTTLDYQLMLDNDRREGEHITVVKDEYALFTAFLDWCQEEKPDWLTAWNSDGFDFPYLVNRGKKLGLPIGKMSPLYGKVKEPIKEYKGNLTIAGLTTIDYLELYKKLSYGLKPNYKLETIAQLELKTGKVDYGEYGDMRTFYEKNPTGFVRYNIVDTLLLKQLDEKRNFTRLAISLAYDAHCNYQDMMGQVRFWDCLLYNDVTRNSEVIPPHSTIEPREFDGAFVSEPRLGKSRWVISFDVTSMYPHIMMQYNMGRETLVHSFGKRLVEDLIAGKDVPELAIAKANGWAIAANGACFKKDKPSYMVQAVKREFNSRKRDKQAMLAKEQELETTHNEQQKALLASQIAALSSSEKGKKTAINSVYGACGNQYFRYYVPDIAEAITLTGQTIIQYAARGVCAFLDTLLKTDTGITRWLYTDTDAFYLDASDLVEQLSGGKPFDEQKMVDALAAICKKEIEPELARLFDAFAERTNAYESKIHMKREIIGTAIIFRAKKNYLARILDSEGVRFAEPHLKMMGVETARSTTPEPVKKALKACYKMMLEQDDDTEFLAYIDKFKAEYMQLPLDDIATPRGVNDMEKYTNRDGSPADGRTPYHTLAAIKHNQLIAKLGLTHIPPIVSGDKVKILKLKPNPHNIANIAYKDTLPPEFHLDAYVDKDALYQASFHQPVMSFANLLGWREDAKPKLEDFFS